MKRIQVVGGTTAVLLLFLATNAPIYAQEEHGKGQEKQQSKSAQPQQHTQQPQQHAQQPQQHAQQPQQPQQPRPRAQQPQQQAQQPRQQARPEQQPQQHAQQPQQHAQQPQQYATRTQQPQRRAQQPPRQAAYPVQQRTQEQARGWQQQRGWLQQGGGWQGHGSWQQARSSHWQTDHRTWAQRGGYGGYYIPQDRFSLYFGAGHWFRIHSQPIIVGGYPEFQYGGFSFMLVDPWPESWSENWYDSDDVYVDYDNGYYLYNRRDPSVAIALSVVL